MISEVKNIDGEAFYLHIKIPNDAQFICKRLKFKNYMFYCTSNSVFVPNIVSNYGLLISGKRVTAASIPLEVSCINDINFSYEIYGERIRISDLLYCKFRTLVVEWQKDSKTSDICNNAHFRCANLKTIYARYETSVLGVRIDVNEPILEREYFVGLEIIPVNVLEGDIFDTFLLITDKFLLSNDIDDAISIIMDHIYPLAF